VGIPAPRMFDQNAPHRPRSDPEKVGPVGKAFHPAEQSQVSLMDQGSRTQGVVRALAAQLRRRELAQLVVDQGEEPVHGV
jgi:hypothetical protein